MFVVLNWTIYLIEDFYFKYKNTRLCQMYLLLLTFRDVYIQAPLCTEFYEHQNMKYIYIYILNKYTYI